MASFTPIIGTSPRVLILGSMPSQMSLSEQQYYANPRNAFWWLMAELLERPLPSRYDDRMELLKLAGIAVWDVLYNCDRPGSLDTSIVRSSEQANDIDGLLASYPSIRLVGFNGVAAKAIFKRHREPGILQLSGVKFVQLPSTSPAHASLTRVDKLNAWRAALSDVL